MLPETFPLLRFSWCMVLAQQSSTQPGRPHTHPSARPQFLVRASTASIVGKKHCFNFGLLRVYLSPSATLEWLADVLDLAVRFAHALSSHGCLDPHETAMRTAILSSSHPCVQTPSHPGIRTPSPSSQRDSQRCQSSPVDPGPIRGRCWSWPQGRDIVGVCQMWLPQSVRDGHAHSHPATQPPRQPGTNAFRHKDTQGQRPARRCSLSSPASFLLPKRILVGLVWGEEEVGLGCGLGSVSCFNCLLIVAENGKWSGTVFGWARAKWQAV